MKIIAYIFVVFLCRAVCSFAEEDILLFDFESSTYEGWNVEGNSFGQQPCREEESKNPVVGFHGVGFINSYHDRLRDKAVGTLTSHPFKIERNSIRLLIGGGCHPEETCANLLVNGTIVRTAAGSAQKDDKNQEVMAPFFWDVSEFIGQDAQMQIVDNYTGGWGHILIDDIVQSNVPLENQEEENPEELYPSKVPHFSFSDVLEEQEQQLATNALILRFKESRARMGNDPYRPIYHYVNPENSHNDPNGLCHWQGRWHLFYQGYPPEDPRPHWGHAVSDDLVHWKDLPYAIYPGVEKECFSGACFVEEDRVVAMYHGTQAGSMIAISRDPLLLNWEKLTGKAVISLPKAGETFPYRVFDPCVWKKEGSYYALTGGQLPNGPGGKMVRAFFLHKSEDLASWEYLHPFVENDLYGHVGDDGACPYFWPIGNHGKHILLHFSHTSGGKYLLGDYDQNNDKFIVTDGGEFDHGAYGPGGVHAPSASPDGTGGVVVIFNMNPGKYFKGWAQIMTLPMRLAFVPDDRLNPLRFTPIDAVQSLRGAVEHVDEMRLPANEEVVFDGIQGNAMEIMAEIDPEKSQSIELNVLRSPNSEEVTRIDFYKDRGYPRTRDFQKRNGRKINSVITIDNLRSSTLPDARSRPPETAQFFLDENETLKLRVFIDRSVVEVYANDKLYAALRVYPGRDDSLGVSLRSIGRDATLKSLMAWQMKTIYHAEP